MKEPCVVCGRAAGYQWTEHGVEEALCSTCLEARLPGFGLAQIDAGLRMHRPRRDRCPRCQTTREQAMETGLAGCPLCYEVFDDAVWQHFGITRGSWTASIAN